MQQELVNRSPDLKRLSDEGYTIEIVNGYFVVHHIPYLNSRKEIAEGKIVVRMHLQGNVLRYAGDHTVLFVGEFPCNIDGTEVQGIKHCAKSLKLRDGLQTSFSFSNRPKLDGQVGYKDHYEQISRYVQIISAPAIFKDSTVSPNGFKKLEGNSDSVFKYEDTNTSRANTINASNKLKGLKIAIIGVGGSGSYILDSVAKTPVQEIHVFDKDVFSNHNAFRAPGAPSIDMLAQEMSKAKYFESIYSNMHSGITAHECFIDEENVSILTGMDYVFISIDNGSAKIPILQHLMKESIPFVDVGMGVDISGNDSLSGILRVVSAGPHSYSHVSQLIDTTDGQEDEYATNIQIADLNALNGILAVIQWKKHFGFYQNLKDYNSTFYTLDSGEFINENK